MTTAPTSPSAQASDERLRGTISAFGLRSGDRIVVGAWHRSPVGPFADVMWAGPDGTRVLLAPDRRAADYVAGIYRFDRIDVVQVEWTATPARLLVVEVHGTSPLGVEEWYQARAWRWIHDGRVRVDGRDQGAVGPVRPPLRVGFSEPPPRPSITDLAVRVRRR